MSLLLLPIEIILSIFNIIINKLKSFESFFDKKSKLIKYQVDYMDPTNFIYVVNNQKLENFYKNGLWDYNKIYDLYMKYFYEKTVRYVSNSGSRPVKITSFPVQPKMTNCYIENNNLTTFPVQPEMTFCSIQNNNLTTFPVQPKMTSCYIENNKLTNFPVQPKMTHCYLKNNQLTIFPLQPEMTSCSI